MKTLGKAVLICVGIVVILALCCEINDDNQITGFGGLIGWILGGAR